MARKFNLSPAEAGVFISVFFFARTIAFLCYWWWSGWHYRVSWLIAAYLGMIAGFSLIFLSETLWFAVLAQVLFGLSIGLIYYSSLFYSMDVGETKGEHGGFHEAAIGAGNCVGPLLGAAALYFVGRPHAHTWAVSGLLCVGFVGLLWLNARSKSLAKK
jgi:MFS family permease